MACGSTLAAAASGDDAHYLQAVAMYKSGRWAGAFGRFASLADGGHSDAARIALHMLRYDKELYGGQWTASAGQLRRWNEAAQRGALLQVVHNAE